MAVLSVFLSFPAKHSTFSTIFNSKAFAFDRDCVMLSGIAVKRSFITRSSSTKIAKIASLHARSTFLPPLRNGSNQRFVQEARFSTSFWKHFSTAASSLYKNACTSRYSQWCFQSRAETSRILLDRRFSFLLVENFAHPITSSQEKLLSVISAAKTAFSYPLKPYPSLEKKISYSFSSSPPTGRNSNVTYCTQAAHPLDTHTRYSLLDRSYNRTIIPGRKRCVFSSLLPLGSAIPSNVCFFSSFSYSVPSAPTIKPHTYNSLNEAAFSKSLESSKFHRRQIASSSGNPAVVTPPSLIRNVAVIAHVDHGKTTLVDSLLRQAGLQVSSERMLDSNQLEKERGITILSKVTRLHWEGCLLNIVDTPGHADFGGEVERVLSMVDGVLLLVDIVEGPRPQTKFVLQKALQNPKCVPLVVINKADRMNDRKHGDCENEIFDLFASLGANDEQLEYSVLYASGKNNWCTEEWDNIPQNKEEMSGLDMGCLLSKIVSVIPPPGEDETLKDEFSFLTTLIEHQDNIGVVATGKVYSGSLSKMDVVCVKDREGKSRGFSTIKSISMSEGTSKKPVEVAGAGDIVSLSFTRGVIPNVTDTVTSSEKLEPISSRAIDPPVVYVKISPNTSPLVGQDGSQITLAAIGKRLKKEALVNVAIEVEESPNKDSYEVRGRGELQLGILIETMRREGFEMTISPPSVVYKRDTNGKLLEPWEEFIVEIPNEAAAAVMEKLETCQSEIIDVKSMTDSLILKFHCSSSNFMGLRSFLRDVTKGTAAIFSEYLEHRPYIQPAKGDRNGVLISSTAGITSVFSLESLQSKGVLFTSEGVPTYEGMILGESFTSLDLEMNAVKLKPLSNFRTKSHDESVKINWKNLTIENCLAFIQGDEQLEVTPKRVAMRKKILNSEERKLELKRLAGRAK